MIADSATSKWRPGWPWELELLTILFVLAAAAIPLYTCYSSSPPTPTSTSLAGAYHMHYRDLTSRNELITNLYWGFAVVALYLIYLLTANYTRGWISAPLSHFLAPLIFAGLGVYRLSGYCPHNLKEPIMDPSALNYGAWGVGTLCLVFLAGQLTRWRHLRRFRHQQWLVDSPTALDRTFLRLIPFLRPLFYPPVRYRLAEEGILIEGVNYVIALPMDIIQTVEYATLGSSCSSAFVVATSARYLVRIRLKHWSEPLLVSPLERESFVSKALEIIDSRRPATRCGTRPGTRRGTRSSRHGARLSRETDADEVPARVW